MTKRKKNLETELGWSWQQLEELQQKLDKLCIQKSDSQENPVASVNYERNEEELSKKQTGLQILNRRIRKVKQVLHLLLLESSKWMVRHQGNLKKIKHLSYIIWQTTHQPIKKVKKKQSPSYKQPLVTVSCIIDIQIVNEILLQIKIAEKSHIKALSNGDINIFTKVEERCEVLKQPENMHDNNLKAYNILIIEHQHVKIEPSKKKDDILYCACFYFGVTLESTVQEMWDVWNALTSILQSTVISHSS